MTVLGLLPPMIVRGDTLVDGGYVNNLPVDVMRDHCSTVIACDVENKDNSACANLSDLGEGVSGWWILLMKLSAWTKVPDFGMRFLLLLPPV
jgi:lysophospholipid hydrolase